MSTAAKEPKELLKNLREAIKAQHIAAYKQAEVNLTLTKAFVAGQDTLELRRKLKAAKKKTREARKVASRLSDKAHNWVFRPRNRHPDEQDRFGKVAEAMVGGREDALMELGLDIDAENEKLVRNRNPVRV